MGASGGETTAGLPSAASTVGSVIPAAGADVALEVALIPVLEDNYVFVLHNGAAAAVVDPAVAEPVAGWLQARGLRLTAVLQTHHHWDHIGGTPELLRRWPEAAVIAAAADRDRIPFQTLSVGGGDRFTLLGRAVEVLAVPGHTRAHLAFYLPPVPGGHGELFCGDALFAAGCGRLLEGTASQMHRSLQAFAALPEATRVWCAHEYTLANLRWAAATAEPGGTMEEGLAPVSAHRAITARLVCEERRRRRGEATIPTTIALERATNLFLRARSAEVLAVLRHSKDHWRG